MDPFMKKLYDRSINGEYVLIERLSRGGFGVVYLGMRAARGLPNPALGLVISVTSRLMAVETATCSTVSFAGDISRYEATASSPSSGFQYSHISFDCEAPKQDRASYFAFCWKWTIACTKQSPRHVDGGSQTDKLSTHGEEQSKAECSG